MFDIRIDTRYGTIDVKTFRHKGLKRLIESDHLPGYRLYALRGELRGRWIGTVSGNWRIVFRFEAGDASDIDLVDYR